jgi:hypothetical protein
MVEEERVDTTILPPRSGGDVDGIYDRLLDMVPPFDDEAESQIYRWGLDAVGTAPPPAR